MPIRPFKSWATKKLNDPTDRIERHLTDRIKRVIIGLHLPQTLDRLHGSLVITTGRGRYLRLLHFDSVSISLPGPLANSLSELVAEDSRDFKLLAESLADLADFQLMAADQLKRKAGKYVDRVLAISVFDDGIIRADFDGRMVFRSLVDAARLAELTGISVIDSFQERDIVADGDAQNLMGLPFWLMFADRDERVSQFSRVLVNSHASTDLWYLPQSDGLDLNVPDIRFSTTVGSQFVESLFRRRQIELSEKNVTRFYAEGKRLDNLASQMETMFSAAPSKDKPVDSMLDRTNELPLPDLIHTILNVIGKRIAVELSATNPDQVYVSATRLLRAPLISELQNRIHGVEIIDLQNLRFHQTDLASVGAAILGMLHIDQMPANIPALTGASAQRILGRIACGTPTNYRQLLTTMSDFSPPAMKLRDAV